MAFFFSSGFYCCYNSGRQRVCSMEQHQFSSALKFRYCEKASKFEKNIHLVLKLLSNVKTRWVFFQIFVVFPEYLNFTMVVSTSALRATSKLMLCRATFKGFFIQIF